MVMTGNPKGFREKSVSVLIWPLQISFGRSRDWTRPNTMTQAGHYQSEP
jgi:hypothetical protein